VGVEIIKKEKVLEQRDAKLTALQGVLMSFYHPFETRSGQRITGFIYHQPRALRLSQIISRFCNISQFGQAP